MFVSYTTTSTMFRNVGENVNLQKSDDGNTVKEFYDILWNEHGKMSTQYECGLNNEFSMNFARASALQI